MMEPEGRAFSHAGSPRSRQNTVPHRPTCPGLTFVAFGAWGAHLAEMSNSDNEPNEVGEPGAARDLADGLDLMLRAAKKAIRGIDGERIENLGRRAVQSLEGIDRQRVAKAGRQAVRNLDPKRIEEVAEEAGRELLNVVERVAERMEGLIKEKPAASEAETVGAVEEEAEKEEDAESNQASKPPQRIRVDGE